MLLRQELLHGFFGWITYSLTRSERRDHPDTAWRLFDFDQTQALGVVASYQLGHGWEVGARFRYTTGFPRTPVIPQPGVFDDPNNQYDPIFGAHNSIRIPCVLPARRAPRELVRLPAREAQRLPRRAEHHQPAEPRGDHLQLQLHGEGLHHRLPDAGGAGRQGGVLMRHRLLRRAPGAWLALAARLQARSRIAAVAGHRAAVPGGARHARPRRPRAAWSPTTRWSSTPNGTVTDAAIGWAQCLHPQSAGQRERREQRLPLPSPTTPRRLRRPSRRRCPRTPARCSVPRRRPPMKGQPPSAQPIPTPPAASTSRCAPPGRATPAPSWRSRSSASPAPRQRADRHRRRNSRRTMSPTTTRRWPTCCSIRRAR